MRTHPTRKIVFENMQSPGDVVMLSAALRDLHRVKPCGISFDVRTPCPEIWENNPYISRIEDDDNEATRIKCEYPLIHRSNETAYHFIHGFCQDISKKTGVQITPTDFKGDIHISDLEKSWISQVEELTERAVPFWIVVAGGKWDFTIKWWNAQRFQRVVDHFKNKILFVQVGEKGHLHPPLKNVVDLRGKTDLRQLIRLVYHAQGVLCPVTLLMHLAAAVETKEGSPRNRPCVVVAGGREPCQWEAYPHHQFIHTNGALRCCEQGGCWRSRVTPIGDGDEKDRPENLCTEVVRVDNLTGERVDTSSVPGGRFQQSDGTVPLPRCMDLISVEDVCRRIQLYFDGGSISYLSPDEIEVVKTTLTSVKW